MERKLVAIIVLVILVVLVVGIVAVATPYYHNLNDPSTCRMCHWLINGGGLSFVLR